MEGIFKDGVQHVANVSWWRSGTDRVEPLEWTAWEHCFVFILMDYATWYPKAVFFLRTSQQAASWRHSSMLSPRSGFWKKSCMAKACPLCQTLFTNCMDYCESSGLTCVYHTNKGWLVEQFNQTHDFSVFVTNTYNLWQICNKTWIVSLLRLGIGKGTRGPTSLPGLFLFKVLYGHKPHGDQDF